MFKLTIQSLPPTDNHLYGQTGHRRFMYKAGKDWKENLQLLAKTKWENKELLTGELFAEVRFHLKRDRDIHGSLKLIFDALENIVYENDKQIVREFLYKEKSKEPRIEISITP